LLWVIVLIAFWGILLILNRLLGVDQQPTTEWQYDGREWFREKYGDFRAASGFVDTKV
jgi:hypothetical protein